MASKRLTKWQKEAFVRAVMNDVPKVDYQEQAHELIRKAVVDSLPPKVREIYEDKSLQHFLGAEWVHVCNAIDVVSIRGAVEFKPSNQLKEECKRLGELDEQQDEKLYAMRASLRGIIESCSTLAAAKKRLPEFEKYLPKDDEPETNRNLPVANVVADLIELGWPKDKEAAQ